MAPLIETNRIIPGKQWLGYTLQMLNVIFLCTGQFFTKLFFIKHPEMSTAEFMAIRQIVTAVLMVMVMNTDTNRLLFHTV